MARPTKEELLAQAKLYKIIDKHVESIANNADKTVDKQAKLTEKLKQRAIMNEQLLEFANQDKDARKDSYKDEEKLIELREKSGQLSGEALKYEKAILEEKKKLLGAVGPALDLQKEQLQSGIDYYKLQKKSNEEYEKSLSSLKSIGSEFGSILGIGRTFNSTVIGGLVTGMEDLLKITIQNRIEWGKILESGANLAAGFILARSEEVIFAQDTMLAGFKANTGASEEFANSVYGASEGLRGLGLNMAVAGEAGAALFDNVTAYKDASGAARIEAAEFTGILVELGVGAGEVAELTQTLTQGLGMTMTQAMATEKEMLSLARGLDMNMAQAITDLNALAPELIAHGDNMIEVFKGMEKQARKTGLATDKLMGIAAQYDTFEGAATAVGRLNGILGGPYLNSIEMLYATEDERLQLLRESLAMSGRQFSDLSRFEQKALAAAGGFQSAGEAAAFFNGSLDDPKVQESVKTQEDLVKIAREMKPMFERLQLALNKFAMSFMPVIEAISAMIEWINKLNVWVVRIIGGLGLVVTVAWKVVGVIRAWQVQTVLLTGVTRAQITADAASNVVKKQSIGLSIKGLAIGTKTFALNRVRNAMALVGLNTGYQLNLMKKRSIMYGLQSIAWKLKDLVVMGLSTAARWASVAATWAWTAAQGAWNVITIIGTGLMTAFGIVASVALGGIPLLIAGIVVGLTAVVYYWDEVTSAFQAGFETIKSAFTSLWDLMKGFMNFALVKPINFVISGINLIPGIDIPKIPELQGGTANFTGGPAILGEKGPELAYLQKGTTVVPHKKTVGAAKEALGVTRPKETAGAGFSLEDLKTAFKSSLQEVLGDRKAGAQKALRIEIPVMLDKREIGRVVKNVMNKELGPGSWAGV